MAKTCDFSAFFMNIFHDDLHDLQRIDLLEYWVDFNKANTLSDDKCTLT